MRNSGANIHASVVKRAPEASAAASDAMTRKPASKSAFAHARARERGGKYGGAPRAEAAYGGRGRSMVAPNGRTSVEGVASL
jgi:hypothetical protein